MAGAHPLEVQARVLEPANLLVNGQGGAVDAADQGGNEFAPEGLEVGFQGEQLVVVLDENVLVANRLFAHILQEQAVLLVLLHGARLGAEDARPEGAEQVGVHFLLGVALADDGAREVLELVLNGLEEGEEAQGVLQLVVDGLLEDGEELVEGALQRLARALRVGEAKDRGRDGAEGGGRAGRGLEDAGGAEEGVDVVEG